MRLGAHEEGMLLARELEDLHNRLGGMLSAENEAVLFESWDVLWIDLVAMAEAEADLSGVVEEARGERIGEEVDVFAPEAHVAAEAFDFFLFGERVDHAALAVGLEF